MIAMTERNSVPEPVVAKEAARKKPQPGAATPPREVGGPKGLEPTRYGDWESNGRCSDF
jgi:hypothetical protein